MWEEIKLMKPKSKDKLAGRDSIINERYTKDEVRVYSEPPGGYPEPEVSDVIKVIYNDYNGGRK